MQKKIANLLFSTRLTAVLFIVFAVAMAWGTFLDVGQDTSPTPYSRTLIFNAWWFEAIMVFFVINFVGNIFRFKLYKPKKWATLTLHLSFIFILLGAFITRYIGYEGVLAIREGATENVMLSRSTYVTMIVDGDSIINNQAMRRTQHFETDFSPRLNNSFEVTTDYFGDPIKVELTDFIAGAEKDIVPDENGENYLKMVEAGSNGPHNHFLKEGQTQLIHNVLYALNIPTEGAINITHTDSTLTIQSPFEGEYLTMATQTQGKLVKDSLQPLALRSRYIIGEQSIVFPKPVVKGVFDVVKKSTLLKGDEDGIVLNVTADGETKQVKLLGGQGSSNALEKIKVGKYDIALRYGAKLIELPFSVKLNDFIAEKYPGTQNSYASYESKVTVLDQDEGDFDFHIYMNNILDHRGYRFFQASFDPDEKGTVLSVNHDFWGTYITYFGYFLLYFGLMAILFSKNTRFDDIRTKLNKIKKQKSKLLTSILLLFCFIGTAQNSDSTHEHQTVPQATVDSILSANIASKEEAAKFGRLVIQDYDGRMKPVNTYASELLRKLSKKDTYNEYNAEQVFLSMLESEFLWYEIPVIYLRSKKADTIRSLIGVSKDTKYARLGSFFTENGSYKLQPYLNDAYKANPPNAFQKEFKEADQRVNLLYNTLKQRSLKVFPVPNDDNNTWISPVEYREGDYKFQDSLYGNFINTGFKAYLFSLNQGKQTGNFDQAHQLLNGIKKNQQVLGEAVMLSDKKIETEIRYNKYDIFKKLFSWYLYAGTLMFIFLIVQIFNDKSKWLPTAVNISKWVIVGLFVLHTLGLIARWYLSGHAPWSDAYESMIYVAWAIMLFGLLFGRKSMLAMAAAAFITAMMLMIAHWNWMDPSIGNLQPVLDSYWLMIHVAVIVGSYGPLALGMILGAVALLLMILTNDKNKKKMDLNIKEVTIVNEMALTVGLVMLTIGNFLGGMWANESWGRYWGWDPKETWALISIMIYAFVIHIRLIPGLRGRFLFNLLSIYAYASILMTYFGVNFYLAGLHSYAKDDQEISVYFIAGAFSIVALLGFLAYRKYKVYYK